MATIRNKKKEAEANVEVEVELDEVTVEMEQVEEVSTDVATIVVDEEEPKEEIGVTLDTTEIKKPQKLVRIKVQEKFKCYVGEWYYFEKNRVYSVPEHVKEHLMKRGKLLPM